MKHLFSDKSTSSPVNNLVINGKIVMEDDGIAQNLNNYFPNAGTSLDIQGNRYLLTDSRYVANPIDAAIKTFELHLSILKIKERVKCPIFSFSEVTLDEMEQYL